MILMNDFKAESKILKEDMLAAVSRVIDSGWYVLGHETPLDTKIQFRSVCEFNH